MSWAKHLTTPSLSVPTCNVSHLIGSVEASGQTVRTWHWEHSGKCVPSFDGGPAPMGNRTARGTDHRLRGPLPPPSGQDGQEPEGWGAHAEVWCHFSAAMAPLKVPRLTAPFLA